MNTLFMAHSSLFSFDTVVVPHTEFFSVLPTATPTFSWDTVKSLILGWGSTVMGIQKLRRQFSLVVLSHFPIKGFIWIW